MAKISKETTIGEIVKMNPKCVETLMTFGMGCVGCPSSQGESLAEAAQVHGIDVDNLLRALNALV